MQSENIDDIRLHPWDYLMQVLEINEQEDNNQKILGRGIPK